MLAQGTDLYVVKQVLEHSSVPSKTSMASREARSAKLLADVRALLTPNGSRNGSQSPPAPDADAG